MKRSKPNVMAYGIALSTLLGIRSAEGGPEVCASGGGPTICARFDNLPATPIETSDYVFNVTTNPSNPSVELLRGESQGWTLYQWRVWSKKKGTFCF